MNKKVKLIKAEIKNMKIIPQVRDNNGNILSSSSALLILSISNKEEKEENIEAKYCGLIYNIDNKEREFLLDEENNILRIEDKEPFIIPCSKPLIFILAFLKNSIFMLFLFFLFCFSALTTSYLLDGSDGYINGVLFLTFIPVFLDVKDNIGLVITLIIFSIFLITYSLSLYRIFKKEKRKEIKYYNIKGTSFIEKLFITWKFIP